MDIRHTFTLPAGCARRLRRLLGLGLAAFVLCHGPVLTAQEPAAVAPPATFTFLVATDPHLHDPRNGTAGPGRFRAVFTAAKARPMPPDFVIVTGDIIPPTDPATHQPDLSVIQDMAKIIPLHVTPGNNDSAAVRAALRQAFPADLGERDFYAFTHKGCRFIVACDAIPGDHYGHFESQQIAGQPQCAWLTAELGRRADYRRVFLFSHIPPHPDGASGSAYLGVNDQTWLRDLVARTKPDALFFGHLHRKVEFRVAETPAYVVPSTNWNYNGLPPAFCEVTVAPDAVKVEWVELPDVAAAGK